MPSHNVSSTVINMGNLHNSTNGGATEGQLNVNNAKEKFLDKTANFIVNTATSNIAKNTSAAIAGACLTEVILGMAGHIHAMTKDKSDENDMLTPQVNLALLAAGGALTAGARMVFHWAKHRNDARQEQTVGENRLDNNKEGLTRF